MKILKIVGIGLFLTGIQCTSPKPMDEKTTQNEASVVALKQQVAEGAFLVDVRTKEEFESGSVKGAVNIPLLDIENRIKEFEGKPHVIVFCRSGHRAGIAKNTLENNNIKNVTNGINVDHMNEELQQK